MGFKAIILVVEDVIKSRKLYEEVLECKVMDDFGECNVGFEGGFALYQKEFFKKLAHREQILSNANNLSIYFEFDDIQAYRDRIVELGFELLHDIEEQPWGQKVFRFYDYDKHIVEMAEDMNFVLVNMYKSGMSKYEIAKKTGYSEEVVTQILKL